VRGLQRARAIWRGNYWNRRRIRLCGDRTLAAHKVHKAAFVSDFREIKFRQIDDPVGSIPVHLTGGVIGVLMAPLFANKEEEYSFIHWKGCDFDCVGEINSTCVYNLGFQVCSRMIF